MNNVERGRNVLRHISALAVIALAFGVAADDPDFGPVSSLKVDLEKVVELGTVSPVDGILPIRAEVWEVHGTSKGGCRET